MSPAELASAWCLAVTTEVDGAFNALEACLWAAIAGGLAWRGARQATQDRGAWWALVAAFACFGVSDLVEVWTGAWWRPWPLLVLKVACVLAIASLGWRLWPRRLEGG